MNIIKINHTIYKRFMSLYREWTVLETLFENILFKNVLYLLAYLLTYLLTYLLGNEKLLT